MVLIHVQPLSTVREQLSQVVARFRREGADAEPVVFGTHRRPEAALVPYDAYAEFQVWRQRMEAVRESARSVQVELPGPFGPAHEEAVTAYAVGEIDADEVYERTLAHYRRQ